MSTILAVWHILDLSLGYKNALTDHVDTFCMCGITNCSPIVALGNVSQGLPYSSVL